MKELTMFDFLLLSDSDEIELVSARKSVESTLLPVMPD